MTANIDNTINALCEDSKIPRVSRCPLATILVGLGSVSLYITLFVYLTGLRSEIAWSNDHIPYLLEIIFAALVVITAIFAASWQAFPDLSERKFVAWLPSIPLFGFFMSFGLNYALMPGKILEVSYGMQCAMHLCLMALVPAALLYVVLARGVFLHAGRASLHVGLAAAMTAYLTARLVEPVDDMLHFLVWHILPLIMLVILLGAMHRWLIRRKQL